ncbi:putative DNA-binding transcriptional regulator YafY [Clostridium moniliforme]|uniref:DNA-binding transcriptional regulator YafY n=1 Tax=Clostridium moniliforme TaxID=39489 RepID=A0ABS4EZ07_9CLOT|nr:WYL domain-containing protein [Clostridium moniliforme]MBP1889234.1 putative DNA-binding transcriptional regulator YafY [Clostridium moniliforme]
MGKVNNALNMLMLLKSREKMTRKEIAEELEVDIRQISRYKDDLCMAGIIIEEERGRYGGYRIKENISFNANLTNDEIRALELAINCVQEGTFPLKKEFNSGVMKILSNYKKVNGKRFWNKNPTFQVKRKNKYNKNLKEKWFIINECIVNSKKIKILYSNLNDVSMTRIVWPYAIYLYQEANYMLAYCEVRKEIRNFKLVRIEKLEKLDETFDKGSFNVKEYLNSRIGIYNDGEKVKVKLKIYYPYAKCFKEHRWVVYESIEDYSDKGYLIYEGIIEGKTDVVKWIIEMGRFVEVLEPKEIKDEIINECKKILELYNN